MYDLHGRTVIVTGSGGGIGRSIALRLAREGCNIGVLDISEVVAAGSQGFRLGAAAHELA